MTDPQPTPCLWFNNNAAQAAQFYCTVFEDGEILSPSDLSKPTFMVTWQMNGQKVMGLNGGPKFPQSAAFSFFIEVENQEELDHYWHALLADGGQESMCGWLEDQFGVSWQVIPKQLAGLVGNSDPKIAKAATDAMLQMRKIIIADLEAAAANAG
jgi:predicted 3-demethylubiquinone-9 3-methyltransferase (glyoxalase superfamily)